MLENFLRPQLEEMDVADAWFQQDGANAHTARRSMQVFAGNVSGEGDIPARRCRVTSAFA
jgi:hypothetical protein